jgi:energy-coupling factor transporter ATP-binding protein EcfA2
MAVARGELLGFAGLVGAGRSEVAQAIFGVEPALGGTLTLDGAPLAIGSPRDAIDAGIFLVPEDRRRTGLVTEMTVGENITLPGLSRHVHWGLRNTETHLLVRFDPVCPQTELLWGIVILIVLLSAILLMCAGLIVQFSHWNRRRNEKGAEGEHT